MSMLISSGMERGIDLSQYSVLLIHVFQPVKDFWESRGEEDALFKFLYG